MSKIESLAAADLLRFAGKRRFATILADPPWQFTNKTGKVAPEHKRLSRYSTMKLDEIMAFAREKLRRKRKVGEEKQGNSESLNP